MGVCRGRPCQDFSTQLELGDPLRAPLNPRHGASDEEFLINFVEFPSSEAPSLGSRLRLPTYASSTI